MYLKKGADPNTSNTYTMTGTYRSRIAETTEAPGGYPGACWKVFTWMIKYLSGHCTVEDDQYLSLRKDNHIFCQIVRVGIGASTKEIDIENNHQPAGRSVG